MQRFQTLTDILDDVEPRAAGSVASTGNWTAAQIVQHIADSIGHSVDGYEERASDSHRAVARKKRDRLLSEGFPRGIRIPDEMTHLLPDAEVEWETAVANLRDAVQRAEAATLGADHPFLGVMSDEEWRRFHCRHAELHFGFLEDAAADGPS